MSATVTRKLMFFFPKCECEKPIIYHLVKDYHLVVNVFRAKVTPDAEGYLVLDLAGSEEDIERALEYVRKFKVTISASTKGLRWDRALCTDCGACLTHCPTKALRVADPATRKICFEDDKCIECLACLKVCPFGACASVF